MDADAAPFMDSLEKLRIYSLAKDIQMTGCATVEQALDFVREHGVVLVTAKGSAPRLTEAIIGEPIKGSWWAHPQGRRIFAILDAVTAAEQVLVCRLVSGKVTLVHRRLWPALVRLSNRFAPEQLAQVREEHTSSGRHITTEVAFPQWVPKDVMAQAQSTDESAALAVFGPWLAGGKP
jgi:hypothetical protein